MNKPAIPGLDPPLSEEELKDVDMSMLEIMWASTPTERWLRHEQAFLFVRELQAAGERMRGAIQ
jgi:hypothetical protein